MHMAVVPTRKSQLAMPLWDRKRRADTWQKGVGGGGGGAVGMGWDKGACVVHFSCTAATLERLARALCGLALPGDAC